MKFQLDENGLPVNVSNDHPSNQLDHRCDDFTTDFVDDEDDHDDDDDSSSDCGSFQSLSSSSESLSSGDARRVNESSPKKGSQEAGIKKSLKKLKVAGKDQREEKQKIKLDQMLGEDKQFDANPSFPSTLLRSRKSLSFEE